MLQQKLWACKVQKYLSAPLSLNAPEICRPFNRWNRRHFVDKGAAVHRIQGSHCRARSVLLPDRWRDGHTAEGHIRPTSRQTLWFRWPIAMFCNKRLVNIIYYSCRIFFHEMSERWPAVLYDHGSSESGLAGRTTMPWKSAKFSSESSYERFLPTGQEMLICLLSVSYAWRKNLWPGRCCACDSNITRWSFFHARAIKQLWLPWCSQCFCF